MGLSRDRNDIKERSGTIHYSTDFNIDWPTGSYNHETSYSGTICGIQVDDIEGSVTVFNLEKGTSYSYSDNTITCDYSYNYKVTITGTDAQGKPTSREEERSGSGQIKNDLGSITIYTHPGSFNMEATSDSNSTNNIIANVLDSKIINNEWIPHFKAAYRWYNQKNVDYGPTNEIYNPEENNHEGMKVKSGMPVYKQWFNNCMKGMRQFDKSVDDARENDLITARLINQMNFSGIN